MYMPAQHQTVVLKPEQYKSRFAQEQKSPDLIRADRMGEDSASPKMIYRGGYMAFPRKVSNNSRLSSRNRSLSNKPPRAYQTKNFFNQTMTQMVQGKNNELQPLVNKRKQLYQQQQMNRNQSRPEALRFGCDYPANQPVHSLQANGDQSQFSLERTPLLDGQEDDEINNHEFSHDIQIKINTKDAQAKIGSLKSRSPMPRQFIERHDY